MPTYPLNSSSIIAVATSSGGSYSNLNGSDTYARTEARNVTDKPIFMADPLTFTGAEKITGSVSGVYSSDDTAQELVRTAMENNTTIFLKVLRNGTDGKISPIQITQRQSGGNASDDVPTFSFDFQINGSETDVGTGTI